MKFCPSCGVQLERGTRFCPQCGVSLVAFPAPTGLPALRPARTTLNVGAMTLGLLSITLIVGGLSFLALH